MTRKAFGLILIILLLGSAPTAYARKPHHERHLIYLRDIATIDLGEASKRVTERMNGHVYSADIRRARGRKLIYELYATLDRKAAIISVDPRSGQIINATDLTFLGEWKDDDLIKAAKNALIPMHEAINIAQEACEGKAIEAEIDVSDDQVIYEIEVENNSGRCEIMVDSVNGKHFVTEVNSRRRH